MNIKFLAILLSLIFFLLLIVIFFIDIQSPSKKIIEYFAMIHEAMDKASLESLPIVLKL